MIVCSALWHETETAMIAMLGALSQAGHWKSWQGAKAASVDTEDEGIGY
jgi:hypothetical protein